MVTIAHGITLVIPDIHQDIYRAQQIIEKYGEGCDRIVFLGDFFDTHQEPFAGSDIRTAMWIRDNLNNPRYVRLLGNHDLHYMSILSQTPYRCSGFSRNRHDRIKKVLNLRDWRQSTHIFAKIGKYYLSHAGLNYFFIPPIDIDEGLKRVEIDARICIPGALPSWLLCETDGPLWLRWNNFAPIDGISQIFGHTNEDDVRSNGDNYCIDTGLNHVAKITGNQDVEIIKVEL